MITADDQKFVFDNLTGVNYRSAGGIAFEISSLHLKSDSFIENVLELIEQVRIDDECNITTFSVREFNVFTREKVNRIKHNRYNQTTVIRIFWDDDLLDRDETGTRVKDNNPMIVRVINRLKYYISQTESQNRFGLGVYEYMLIECEKVYKTDLDFFNNLTPETYITSDQLIKVFSAGTIITHVDSQDKIYAGMVENCQIRRSFIGSYISCKVKQLIFNGKNFSFKHSDINMANFSGDVQFKELPVKLLTNSTKEILLSRGKQYLDIVKNKFKYSFYTGNMQMPGYWYDVNKQATGRVVIDEASYALFNENSSYLNSYDDDDVGVKLEEIVSNEQLQLILPSQMLGYSLRTKMWGKFSLDGLSEIEFDKDAYKNLVMSDEQKEFLKTLSTNTNKFSDLVQSKSGGQIILLHGTPGTGKTLTAESIADMRQVPLYNVSVGELGTDLDELEKNLSQILELSAIWNAIVLIDEADVFLEKRDTSSIVRNAMVGVFLRKLEYFDGMLFLTTNRRDSIDPAVISRITVCLTYKDLGENSRYLIWKNLIHKQIGWFELSDEDFHTLSKFELNGRQIKNIIKNCMWTQDDNSTKINIDRIIKVKQLSMDCD